MKSFFSNIVLFCGGANIQFLRENCPNERHKFYPIGLGVIVTALLAFISMMFATHSIWVINSLSKEIVAIMFSLFWAFAIFTIDWGLIKTMRKPKFDDPSVWDWIKSSIPILFRLAVALIISFSISRPLEVKIYEKRLRAQIEQDRQAFVVREMDKKDEKVQKRKDQIESLTKEGVELLDKKNKSPETVTFKSNMEAKERCEKELSNLKVTNEKKISELNTLYRNLGSPTITPSAFGPIDTTGNRTILTWAVNRRNNIRNVEIPKLRIEVTAKQTECNGYTEQVKSEQEQYQKDFDDKIKTNTELINSGITNVDSIDKVNIKEINDIAKASYISFDTIHPGLITQIESMSNFEKTPEGKSAGWVRLILLLVIICIDTAPIVIKLLTKRGVYEAMQESDEERMLFLTKHEGYSNNHLISQLALAQKTILTKAIQEWKEKEQARSDLAETYINSNQQDINHDNT